MEMFQNPFRPGAGQLPPYLAGRHMQLEYFENNTLYQNPILANLIITGLRGVGKTVLLENLRPIAIKNGWIWAGTDLSESVSVSERNLSTRIITDLSSSCSSIIIDEAERKSFGYVSKTVNENVSYLNYDILNHIYNIAPGLETDKLKKILEFVWENVKTKAKGIVLAYDEAQNLKDQAAQGQYPLSVLLEIIQFIQRKQYPFLLILTGLPTLFPNLVETRTYAERMFHIATLHKLNPDESRDAILVPIKKDNCPVTLTEAAIEDIIKYSGGYPYFIQYISKEIYDSYLQQLAMGEKFPIVVFDDVIRKLDTDFYQGRWNKVTDRQKDLLNVISKLDNSEDEFTLQDIEQESNKTETPFKKSGINLMLKSLSEAGLIYKNRHGKYSFAVPMFSKFIRRELEHLEPLPW